MKYLMIIALLLLVVACAPADQQDVGDEVPLDQEIPVEEPDFSKEIVDRPVVPPEEPEEDTTPVEAESSTSKSWITDLKCENEKLYFLGETKVSGLELQITHTEKIISQN